MTLLRLLWRALRGLVTGLMALLILFEEWGWEPLQRAMAWVGRAPVLRQIEAFIARLSPRKALMVFMLPALLLVPVKIGALWLIAQGHRLLGVGVILLAKVLGTAIVARLFALTRPALMRMPWFAEVYARWTGWKEALLARMRASWPWRAARVFKRALKRRWARWRGAPSG